MDEIVEFLGIAILIVAIIKIFIIRDKKDKNSK